MTLGPMGSAGSVGPVEISMELLGHVKSKGQRPMGLLGQESLMEVSRCPPAQEGLVGPIKIAPESPEKAGLESPGHMGLQGQEGQVEMVLSMEPGAVRFLQLYHEDLLASLGDVALFPLEGMDVTGFRVSDPLTFVPFSHWGSGYLSCTLNLHIASLPWCYSSVEPRPHARWPRSSCRVCWVALAAMC